MIGTPTPDGLQQQVRNTRPATTPARSRPRSRLANGLQGFTWCSQKRGLGEEAQAMAASNAAPRKRLAATVQPDNRQPEDPARVAAAAGSPPAQATAPAKRPKGATRPAFKHLPPGFSVGKEPIGAVRETVTGKAGTRPLAFLVYPPDSKPGSRVEDSINPFRATHEPIGS